MRKIYRMGEHLVKLGVTNTALLPNYLHDVFGLFHLLRRSNGLEYRREIRLQGFQNGPGDFEVLRRDYQVITLRHRDYHCELVHMGLLPGEVATKLRLRSGMTKELLV